MSKYSMKDHTFVLCAYKESAYIEECILSLLNQTKKSHILIATSTPCAYIEGFAKKYGFPYFINTGETGIAEDWNFAISCADTSLVTVAHQDDIYEPSYAEMMVKAMNRHPRTLISFSDYGELRDGTKVDSNRLLRIKRFLLRGLRNPKNQANNRKKKNALRMGSAICCPSVTINRDTVQLPVFRHQFKSNVDWQAWVRMTDMEGAFSFCPRILMYHRIHEESETSNIISHNNRSQEDLEMFSTLWPRPIAKIITRIYKLSERSNRVR